MRAERAINQINRVFKSENCWYSGPHPFYSTFTRPRITAGPKFQIKRHENKSFIRCDKPIAYKLLCEKMSGKVDGELENHLISSEKHNFCPIALD